MFYSFIVNPLPYALVNGVIFGLVLGVTEWLFFRKPIGLSKRWIIMSIIAWELSTVFWALLEDVPALDNTMMQGMLAGALLGLIQWVYLRRISHRRQWWIVARMICGIGLFRIIIYGWDPIAMGFFNGLITGIAAALLLPNLPAPLHISPQQKVP